MPDTQLVSQQAEQNKQKQTSGTCTQYLSHWQKYIHDWMYTTNNGL